MEKRKVFKISIIDKEISRTEFDRNTFYTSDSELTLVFKLIEKDYSYEHGEILLYNENDKSFVTRKVTKKENDFVYELDLDIIPHYGKWKAQLQLVNDGDVYTSKPFDFVIENDLSNLAPQPTLTDINNWATLKQSANELIDEIRDVIVDIERAESERASNENYRKQSESTRVNNEQTRKNSELTRENQENKRQQVESERENNEKQRRIAEFERVENETTRQNAESQRQSMFETNETERQNTFETNETERQSAEIIRVENENQRKIDHANRSAELNGKADKVVLKNVVSDNGWWAAIYGVYSISDGERTYVIRTPSASSRIEFTLDNTIANDVYYTMFEIKPKFPNETYASVGSSPGVKYNPNAGKWSSLSSLNRAKNNERVRFYHRTDSKYVEGDEIRFRNTTAINLTQTFGAGNEPTKEEMDELIKITGYIDGEYALNNKEMLIWTLALVRSNKNAIISLGGTI